jgi:hypothetical protein
MQICRHLTFPFNGFDAVLASSLLKPQVLVFGKKSKLKTPVSRSFFKTGIK